MVLQVFETLLALYPPPKARKIITYNCEFFHAFAKFNPYRLFFFGCVYIATGNYQDDECAMLFLNIKKDSVKSISAFYAVFGAFATPIKLYFDVFSDYFLMWC